MAQCIFYVQGHCNHRYNLRYVYAYYDKSAISHVQERFTRRREGSTALVPQYISGQLVIFLCMHYNISLGISTYNLTLVIIILLCM